ncbi:unnamed protein product [Parascedosporium putredinis]|uniref:Uncharacterized protein n=1 Tax=Parascedosporium putredinis TaxID=1442378 RepID=A0A9P1GUZ5_9PEZI|nr:unnamed protein product [Parascedosporium putredinis]CAI7988147.1 unnamed protein product [Parascedosporium putredinis]
MVSLLDSNSKGARKRLFRPGTGMSMRSAVGMVRPPFYALDGTTRLGYIESPLRGHSPLGRSTTLEPQANSETVQAVERSPPKSNSPLHKKKASSTSLGDPRRGLPSPPHSLVDGVKPSREEVNLSNMKRNTSALRQVSHASEGGDDADHLGRSGASSPIFPQGSMATGQQRPAPLPSPASSDATMRDNEAEAPQWAMPVIKTVQSRRDTIRLNRPMGKPELTIVPASAGLGISAQERPLLVSETVARTPTQATLEAFDMDTPQPLETYQDAILGSTPPRSPALPDLRGRQMHREAVRSSPQAANRPPHSGLRESPAQDAQRAPAPGFRPSPLNEREPRRNNEPQRPVRAVYDPTDRPQPSPGLARPQYGNDLDYGFTFPSPKRLDFDFAPAPNSAPKRGGKTPSQPKMGKAPPKQPNDLLIGSRMMVRPTGMPDRYGTAFI